MLTRRARGSCARSGVTVRDARSGRDGLSWLAIVAGLVCVVLSLPLLADGALSERGPQAGNAVSQAGQNEPASRSESASVRAIRLVFPAHAEGRAIRVARCESRLDPRAVGGAGERGLFQIHPVHFSWADPRRLFEPIYNARVAYRLSRGGTSWRAWTCRWAA